MAATRENSAEDVCSEADELRDGRKFEAAFKRYHDALAMAPDCAAAYYGLGILHQKLGDGGLAVACFRQAAALAPADERVCFCLASALQAQGNVEEAVSLYRRTLQINPDCAPAHYNMGCLLLSTGRFSDATEFLEKALTLAPDFPQAHNNLGAVFSALGRTQQAANHFRAAVRLEPAYTEAHYNMGRLLFSQQKWDEAILHFRSVIASVPDHLDAIFHLGRCHHNKLELDAAQACYLRSAALAPEHTETHLHLARLFMDRDDSERALHWCRRALAAEPAAAGVSHRAGQILERLGRFDEALTCLDAAVDLQPQDVDAHFNRALMLLRLQQFSRGWPEYEWRYKRANWPQAYPHRLDRPRWDGSAFQGKTLLVHCEQGYGDTLQFARYLPLLKSLGGRVLFEVPGPLVELFRHLPGVDEVITLSPAGKTDRPFDLYIPLLSLPGLFNTTLDNVPANLPYVVPDASKVRRWRQRLEPDGFKVGIVWAGSTWHHNDRNRSCSLAQFMPLADVPGIRLIGMQIGRPADEVKELPSGADFCNLGPELHDFTDTAALLSVLDRVISVDTAVVHLAGVMGKSTWVLLPFVPDWRWMLQREDSPWYPSLRLFRQARRGAWADVFERVTRELRQAAGLETGPAPPRCSPPPSAAQPAPAASGGREASPG